MFFFVSWVRGERDYLLLLGSGAPRSGTPTDQESYMGGRGVMSLFFLCFFFFFLGGGGAGRV